MPSKKEKTPDVELDINGDAYPPYLLDKSHNAYNLKIAKNAYNKGISDLEKCQFCVEKNVECVFIAGHAMRRCALCRATGRSKEECDGALIRTVPVPKKRPAEGIPSSNRNKKPRFRLLTQRANEQVFSPPEKPKEPVPASDRRKNPARSASKKALMSFKEYFGGNDMEAEKSVNTMTKPQNEMSQSQDNLDKFIREIEKLNNLVEGMTKSIKGLTKS